MTQAQILYFHNPGIMDIRGATIAGLSAKAGSDKPIGKFGTGLKYAIACILRWQGSITIRAGEDLYTFGADELEFRGENFQQVWMQRNADETKQPLGFTTEYGKQWEPWQVFRELYANALDEAGGVGLDSIPIPRGNQTRIEVDCPQLAALFADRHSIILPRNTSWDVQLPDLGSISQRPSQYLFYRGVRVKPTSSLLTFNIEAELQLTEDRTLTMQDGYKTKTVASRLIQASTSRAVIRTALTAEKLFWEADLQYNEYNAVSAEFLDIAEQLFRSNPRKFAKLRDVLEHHRPKSTLTQLVQLSPIRQAMLERAQLFVARMGIADALLFPVKVAELGGETLGQYKDGEIFLDPKVFDQGTKQLVSTLYEEHIHRVTGYADCTYQMQTHLFNTICSLYEEHVFGEAI